MFVHQLRRAFPPEQHRESVEPRNHALQLHAFHEEDRDRQLGAANAVEKVILQAERSSGHEDGDWLLLLPLALVADAQSLELSMQRRPFHANERCGARDVARKTADLNLQIFALEGFASFPQR